MSIKRLIFFITFLSVFAMAARISVDTDTWWHMRAGQWIVEHKTVPRTDPFSYTRAGGPWQYPGWIVEVPMYWIYQVFGPGGLNLWTAAMVALAFYFVWQTMTGGAFVKAFILVLAATASGVYWSARPHMVTLVLAAIYLWVLEGYRSDRSNRLWLLPLLMVLWVNSHGGFAVGFILTGVYMLGALDRLEYFNLKLSNLQPAFKYLKPLLIIVPLLLLAVFINPYGPVMFLYPFKTVGIEALQNYIQEWQSPDFHQLHVQPFAWLLLITLGLVGFSNERLSITDFLLVTGFALMGLVAGRNIALFALVTPMVASRHASSLLEEIPVITGFKYSSKNTSKRWKSWLNIALLGLVGLAVVMKASLIYPRLVNQEHFNEILPVGAARFIKDNQPEGRLFSSYNWGGYILWALPEYPVFIDGRTDLYDDEIINQWIRVIRAEDGWRSVLDKWDITLILLEPESRLFDNLDAEWNILYQDEVSVLYGKSG
jgi:uncharacterized membrane protein (DUF485 family)